LIVHRSHLWRSNSASEGLSYGSLCIGDAWQRAQGFYPSSYSRQVFGAGMGYPLDVADTPPTKERGDVP